MPQPTNTPTAKYLKIDYDYDVRDPREDNDGFITNVWHRHNRSVHLTTPDSVMPYSDETGGLRKDVAFAAPLYMYSHSGYSLALTPFSCPWDSAQLGYAYITHAALKRIGMPNMSEEEAMKNMASDVKLLNHWMEGNGYLFVVLDEDGEHLDSCGGFLGEDDALAAMPGHLTPTWLPESAATHIIRDALNNPGTRISLS